MKLSTIVIGCLICFLITATLFPLVQSRESGVRGRYIYDYADRISTETELSISSYLLSIDQNTGYEFIVVMPTYKLNESDIINWFNEQGVGKEKKDNGAAIFIFPDNTWFMSIGSGNDKVSVPYSKTQGDRILKNLSDDFSLSLLRYVDAIGKKIDEPKPFEVQLYNSFLDYSFIIFGWIAIIALIILLIQQYDGFQLHDLIIPGILLMIFLLVLVFNTASMSEPTSYSDYGIITSTMRTEHSYSEVHSTGKTTYVDYHTDYINDVSFKSYNLKDYGYQFRTKDNRGAWNDNNIGDIDELTISIKSDDLWNVYRINDFSGGKTIGDGCWG